MICGSGSQAKSFLRYMYENGTQKSHDVIVLFFTLSHTSTSRRLDDVVFGFLKFVIIV